jgi:hypothetical protein
MKDTYVDSTSQQQKHPESATRAAESVEPVEPSLDSDSPAAQRLLMLIRRMIAPRHGPVRKVTVTPTTSMKMCGSGASLATPIESK